MWLDAIKEYLPGQSGKSGRTAKDNRKFINGVFWIIRVGAPWRDLPPDYGKYYMIYKRFIWWAKNGTWKYLFEVMSKDTKLKKCKVNLAIDANWKVIKMIVTGRTEADYKVVLPWSKI